MKNRILSFCSIIGLFIFLLYKLANHYIKITDIVAYPMFIVSVSLMLIGTAYSGWCLGKHKNPFSRE